jgi:hypothetical protein
MLISVGRIRLEAGAGRLWFLWHGAFAYLQAKRADGAVRTSVYRENGRTFWSLSAWTAPEAMNAYRDSGAHARVMKISGKMGAKVDFVHWSSDTIPTWETARTRLIEHTSARSAGQCVNSEIA